MPRTKKTPTSQSLAARATKGPLETPKGSGPSVLPAGLEERVAVPLVRVDTDAGYSPKERDAGAALVWLSANGREEEVTALAMQARNDLAALVHDALGSPESEVASVMTDIAVRYVIRGLTTEAVQVILQSKPKLVMETRRLVEAITQARG